MLNTRNFNVSKGALVTCHKLCDMNESAELNVREVMGEAMATELLATNTKTSGRFIQLLVRDRAATARIRASLARHGLAGGEAEAAGSLSMQHQHASLSPLSQASGGSGSMAASHQPGSPVGRRRPGSPGGDGGPSELQGMLGSPPGGGSLDDGDSSFLSGDASSPAFPAERAGGQLSPSSAAGGGGADGGDDEHEEGDDGGGGGGGGRSTFQPSTRSTPQAIVPIF